MIGDKGRIRFEVEIKKNLGKQEIGTVSGVDKAGVFADPTNAGALGEVPFKDGSGVGIPAILDGTTNLLFDKSNQLPHTRGQYIMIVRPPGVGSDPALISLPFGRGR